VSCTSNTASFILFLFGSFLIPHDTIRCTIADDTAPVNATRVYVFDSYGLRTHEGKERKTLIGAVLGLIV
jgi:hypothetical protein